MTPSNIPHQLLQGPGEEGTKHHRLIGTYHDALGPSRTKVPSAEVVHWMDSLTEHSLYAKECCNRVTTCYHIALVMLYASHTLKGTSAVVCSL